MNPQTTAQAWAPPTVLTVGILGLVAANALFTVAVASYPGHIAAALLMALGLTVAIGAPLLAGTRAARRPQIARRDKWIRFCSAAVIAVTVWNVTPQVAQHFWPTPDQRYQRELGGAGRCLGGTPYAYKAARAVEYDRSSDATLPDRMTIYPGKGGGVPLVLGNAKLGGTHPLTPADDASRLILSQNGC